jgi:hypothetical protein
MNTISSPPIHKPSWKALLIGLIPFIAMCFSIALWDRVHPFIFGLPFSIFWIVAWILLTPLFMSVAYRIETARIASGAGGKEGGTQHG